MSVSPTESRSGVKGETPLWKGKRMKRKLLLMLLCAALGLGAAQAEVYRVESEADVPADWAEKDTLRLILLAPFDYLGVVRTRLPAQIRAFQPEFTCNPICSMLPHASMVSLYLTRVAGNCPRSCPNLICPASSLLHSIA